MSDVQKQLAAWKRANPFRLIQANVIGRQCGRYATLAEAVKHLERKYGVKPCSIDGHDVYFLAPVYC